MIVRDEERNLPKCLKSVDGLFDELVVVDTGSVDSTKEIALACGARVVDFTWCQDFAAARNFSLANATGDYAFWLDADDLIEPPERAKLETLLANLRPGNKEAFVLRCASDPDIKNNGGLVVVDHIRLFPLLPTVRWTYRVHEQIMPSLQLARIPVKWAGITVRHTGYSDGTRKEEKRERDRSILVEALAASPNDPFLLFNIGMIAFERQLWQEALQCFAHSFVCLANIRAGESLHRKLLSMLAWTHQVLGNNQASLHTCNEGLAKYPHDAELLFRKATALRHLGKTAEAQACWRAILRLKPPNNFSSVDQGIYGHLTRRNLAIIAGERGDRAEMLKQWQAVLAECPGDTQATRHLRALTA